MEPDDHARRMIEARLRMGTPQGLAADTCWPWIGKSRSERGYGLIHYTLDGKRCCMTASRAVLALRGDLPFRGQRHHGMHDCDNPPCVNPAHLKPGTPKLNHDDMRAKGRGAKTRRPHTRKSRLSDDDVRAIRLDPRPLAEIARAYAISVPYVSRIKHRRNKAVVPDAPSPGLA